MPPSIDASVQQHRFTVEDFLRMGETGILDPDLRLELLEGRIYEMAPTGSPHAACVDRAARLFFSLLGEGAIVRVQGPVEVNRYTQLLPDLALLRPRDDFYAGAHPRPSDILLLIEIADTTLMRDRREKTPVYGRAGVAESWIVNVTSRRVEVYRDPSPELGYQTATMTNVGEMLSPTNFESLAIDPREILG